MIEIIKLKNKNINKKFVNNTNVKNKSKSLNDTYICKCNSCGTKFTFKLDDMKCKYDWFYYIECPNELCRKENNFLGMNINIYSIFSRLISTISRIFNRG